MTVDEFLETRKRGQGPTGGFEPARGRRRESLGRILSTDAGPVSRRFHVGIGRLSSFGLADKLDPSSAERVRGKAEEVFIARSGGIERV